MFPADLSCFSQFLEKPSLCVCVYVSLSLCISPDAHTLMLRHDGWERKPGKASAASF